MAHTSCKHCGGTIETAQTSCPHCGMPIPAGAHTRPVRRFILFFIAVVLFSLLMMYVLPPDWSALIKK